MRRLLTSWLSVVAALLSLPPSAGPVAAQGRLLARFSESQWREPTFVVDRPAYVAVFEILDGGRVAQRYPRVEAQGASPLPAGETALSYIDVSIGRITDAPGTRTVFWHPAGYGQRPLAEGTGPIARTLLLVASSAPLKIVPSSEFPALAAKAIAEADTTLARPARVVQAVIGLVRAAADVEVATDLQTLWVSSYPTIRGAAVSLAANDPIPVTSACTMGGYGIGVITTYSLEAACPNGVEHAWAMGGWGYGWVPFFPVFGVPNRPPVAPIQPGPVGVYPGTPVTPTGRQAGGARPGIVRVPEPVTQTIPGVRIVHWGGDVAGTGGGAAPQGGTAGATPMPGTPVGGPVAPAGSVGGGGRGVGVIEFSGPAPILQQAAPAATVTRSAPGGGAFVPPARASGGVAAPPPGPNQAARPGTATAAPRRQ